MTAPRIRGAISVVMAGEPPSPKRERIRTARVATQEMVGALTPPCGADSLVVVYAVNVSDITRRFVLDAACPSYLVGRSTECEIVFDSIAASRKHARVDRRENAWWVVDLGSMNGTYVNDARVHVRKLSHGDRIQIGDTIVKHLTGDDVDAAYAEAVRVALVTDGLTQVTNDRTFRVQLAEAADRARSSGTALSLAIADLDHFKAVNDEFGHPAGDRVLREFARIVREQMPVDVLVARVGGEEFALLAPGRTAEQTTELAERARAAVAAHSFTTPKGELTVTASFGVASFTSTEGDTTALFERADRQLYAAKRCGRNRVSQ